MSAPFSPSAFLSSLPKLREEERRRQFCPSFPSLWDITSPTRAETHLGEGGNGRISSISPKPWVWGVLSHCKVYRELAKPPNPGQQRDFCLKTRVITGTPVCGSKMLTGQLPGSCPGTCSARASLAPYPITTCEWVLPHHPPPNPSCHSTEHPKEHPHRAASLRRPP